MPGTRSGTAVDAARAGRVTRSQNGILRMSVPRIRRTDPVRSPSAAVLAMATLRSSGPGTVIVGGAVSVAPAIVVIGSTTTSQAPAPPAASSRAMWAEAVAPGCSSPNETEAGEAKTYGRSALSGFASPPPARVGAAVLSPSVTAVPVSINAALSCATDQVGWRSRRSAAAPEICGVAIDVPDIASQRPPGMEERIDTPGALTSGFRRRDNGVGPDELKSASSLPEASGSVTAPTVIARSDVPGEISDPAPTSSKSFPAATTGTTPAAAAASSARATMSLEGSISGSPSERLITFIPSSTAASIAATISAELPSSPTFASVGTVSAL